MLLLVYSWIAAPQAAEPESTRLCDSIELISESGISLTAVEKRLVCGDEDGEGPNADAWRKVPFSQAKFHLKSFLQERGYFRPVFDTVEGSSGTVLRVNAGMPTIVRQWRMEGAPKDFAAKWHPRKRKVVGAKLTPQLLTDLEQWVFSRLQSEGYACPRVTSEADADRGEIAMKVEAGRVMSLIEIVEEPIASVDPNVMRRYDAFILGERLNRDWLTVSERRMVSQGVLQSVHFKLNCTREGAVATQESVSGPPRLVRIGVGTNTEGVLLARFSWSNQRLGRTASVTEFNTLLSFREITVNGLARWYFLEQPSRKFIQPLLEVRRRDETPFRELSTAGQVSFGTTYDSMAVAFGFKTGPTYEYFKTLEGFGPAAAHFFSLASELQLGSHEFEFHRTSPRTGYYVSLANILNTKSFGSTIDAQQLKLSGLWLSNWRNYDPSLLVFAFRGGFATTLTSADSDFSNQLPPSFRQYLGGARDLRGFGRLELPAGGRGGLTSLYGDFETRLANTIPLGFEPFVFLDVGAIGDKSFRLDLPWYWSPGLGVRWESPVGTMRATTAWGQVQAGSALPAATRDSLSHFQFYFSFGEEF